MKSLIFISSLLISQLFSPNANIGMDYSNGGAYLVLADKFGGNLSQEDLASTNIIEVEGCAKGSKITRYKLLVVKDSKKTRFKGDNNRITDEAYKLLKSLKEGDYFEFSDVEAKLPNSNSTVDVWAKKFFVVS